jgi:DNA helicase-2/ATP-dependent DNA helicase PcrA
MAGGESDLHRQHGPILLLAGPGTGKTYQLALRIRFLTGEKDVPPDQITVISFTAAAAANMRARISDSTRPEIFVESNRQPRHICTMHSLGFGIIRENADRLGLPAELSVVHSDEARSVLLEDAAQLAGYGRDYAKATGGCRQYGECRRDGSDKCAICDAYRDILNACQAIDYDDQILLACRLLSEHDDLAAKYRGRSMHLLVDEYQDINAGQFELISALSAGQREGLFVVGDDDQSIYAWRGGSPAFIRSFKQDFGSQAKVRALRTSRRCHRSIMDGALAVVKAHDKGRLDKGHMTYATPDGPPIHVHSVPSDRGEAEAVCRVIKDAWPSREVLVLVPTRRHGALVVEHLRRSRVPFVALEPVPGVGLPILERLTTWLCSETDNLALRECVEAMVNSTHSPVPSKLVRRPDRKAERDEQCKQMATLWKKVCRDKVSLWDALVAAGGSAGGLVSCIKRQCSRLRSRYEQGNVPGLLWRAAQSLEPWKKTDDLIEEVDTWVSRSFESSAPGSGAQVRIMTLQGGKGLEADVVCVLGLEKGALPRDGVGTEELAEQSRLMYVSMTRARSDLHLFHARTRSGAVSFKKIHGEGGAHTLPRSRFLDALPKICYEEVYHPAKKQ